MPVDLNKPFTVGTFLAERLVQVGVDTYFGVPGDFNLILLDELLSEKRLRYIGCCNELNAGYAADGYARAKGVGAVVVTFDVGGLSLVNAIAGAFSDHLPVIVISGGPNSNDAGTNRVIHHTLGVPEKNQQSQIFSKITAVTEVITAASDAPSQIDRAISTCVTEKKPVYIEISCNIATQAVPYPIPYVLKRKGPSNPQSLQAAVETCVERIKEAHKVVLVAGSKLRMCEALNPFEQLADALGCAVAVMPDAKGMFPENHPQFIGTYWGNVSSPGVNETVESADLYIFVGPIFNDYTTTGYSTLIRKDKMIEVTENRVKTSKVECGCVEMSDFLNSLSSKVPKRGHTLAIFQRIVFKPILQPKKPEDPLSMIYIQDQIQSVLSPTTAVLVETGEAWFTGQKLRMPKGSKYEFQMQWGSIGWSIGATLGYALGTQHRVLLLVGDGSFQVSFQEVSTMIRYKVNPIIILLNNRGYTIESQIHQGDYNQIKNWNYSQLMDVFNAEEGKGWGAKATTDKEFQRALGKAVSHKEGPSLIECTIAPDDCSKELLEWGTRVAAANNRPPRIEENF